MSATPWGLQNEHEKFKQETERRMEGAKEEISRLQREVAEAAEQLREAHAREQQAAATAEQLREQAAAELEGKQRELTQALQDARDAQVGLRGSGMGCLYPNLKTPMADADAAGQSGMLILDAQVCCGDCRMGRKDLNTKNPIAGADAGAARRPGCSGGLRGF